MKLLRTMIFVLAVLMTGTAVAQKGKTSFASMKVAKKGTIEYETQRQAAVQAIDSILYMCGHDRERFKKIFSMADVEKFINGICERFNNDPVLLDSVARAYYTCYGNDYNSEQRYWTLKNEIPDYKEAYLSQARMYHNVAWNSGTNEDGTIACKTDFLDKTKVQIDSAKIRMPNSPEPYMLWVRLQSEYKHVKISAYEPPSIDVELADLKKKFPKYPGYLETAEYYEKILANKQKNFLLDAGEYYVKAGEHKELTAAHWVNLALLCYNYYKSFEGDQRFEKDLGFVVSNKGLTQYPNYPRLLRAKLWNAGQYQKWDDVIKTSKSFFQYGDTLEPSFLDYKWLATAYMAKEQYGEAIQTFEKELAFGLKDSVEHAKAMLNIVDCYNSMKNYEKALIAYSDYEDYKRRKNLEIDVIDYIKAGRSYEGLAADTSVLAATRSLYYEKADSMYKVGGEVSPLNLLLMTRMRWENAFMYAQLLHNDPKNVNGFVAMPVLVDASVRLAKVAQVQLDSLKSLALGQVESRDKYDANIAEAYYLMQQGYYWLMEGVIYSDEKNSREPALKYSEIILDLPDTYDIDGMESYMFPKYEKNRNRAKEIYNKFYPLFGKGKKKRTDI